MALTIASVPVLTGKVGEQFETEAQKAYNDYLNRNDEEKRTVSENYEKGMEIVRSVLAKSHISQ